MPKLTSTSRDAVRFGAILQRLRVARGWSIVTAARRSGMNPNYLGALEKGGQHAGSGASPSSQSHRRVIGGA